MLDSFSYNIYNISILYIYHTIYAIGIRFDYFDLILMPGNFVTNVIYFKLYPSISKMKNKIIVRIDCICTN